MMKRALFIFRRDLRLHDNRGLTLALESAEEVILSFIFTPEQIESNPFKGSRCLQFMIESLEDLENDISKHHGKLHLFFGKPEAIVQECIEKLNIEGVFVNHDYTPYSIRRDMEIQKICGKHSIPFQASHDLLLHPVDISTKGNGEPYTVFTPFFRNASKYDVNYPIEHRRYHYHSQSIAFSKDSSIYKKILPQRKEQALGGRQAGLKIIHNIGSFKEYSIDRDYPERDKTTHLSPHLKFTTCSIREVYHAIADKFGKESDLIRSLYWRDFFTLIGFYFPHIFHGAFKEKFNNISWKDDQKRFDLWCKGNTGFPIVDAGMRELNETGFMHNRARMITASFLVKDLHINWQWGEKYFAKYLIDYDPAVNNGNWQWAASTGCDAQPYFRIFNPWLQAKKFDLDCLYIKKLVPELQGIPSEVIHKWYLEKFHSACPAYPSPIVDHATQAAAVLEMYRKSS